MSFELFATRKTANEGIKLPLFDKFGGATEHWLMVRGVDSDEFRYALSESQREAAEIAAIDDKRARYEAIQASQRKMMASLVILWSFDIEFTPENVEQLFEDAPQVMETVDKVVSNRAFFFALASKDSPDTQSSNSG